MRPIATDRVAWSVCLSVCLSVTVVSPAKTAEPTAISLGCWLGWAQWTKYLMRVQIPHEKWHFWGKWRLDFSACRQTLFLVTMTSGFPQMLLISTPVGQLQKKSRIMLNFPWAEKYPVRCGFMSKFFDHLLLLCPEERCHVLQWVCLSVCLYVTYFKNHMSKFYAISYTC